MTRGLLAIWSDIEPAADADYLHWLTREHTSERVGTVGFDAVRVFRTEAAGLNRYLILYDLVDAGVLTSAAYLARLNDPTPWSRRIMPTLRNFARGGGTVVAEAGRGQGGHLAAFRLARRPDADIAALQAIAGEDRVCAARLLDVDLGGTTVATNERNLRQGDESFAGLLLVEALSNAALRGAILARRDTIAALGGNVTDPLTYTAVFALGSAELA